MPESCKRRMILRARAVVTMDGSPIDNGAVAISGDRIIDVGRFDEVKRRNSGSLIDLGEQALLPGLVKNRSPIGYEPLTRKNRDSRQRITSPRSTKDLRRQQDSARRLSRT
jgi:imidazolonepropionase-like amidohydrolase